MIIIPIFFVHHNSDSASLLLLSHFPLDLSTFHTISYTTAKTKIHVTRVSESDKSVECRLRRVVLDFYFTTAVLVTWLLLLIIWLSHLLSDFLQTLPDWCYISQLVSATVL